MTKLAFWSAALTIAYAYLVFPAMLYLRAKLRPRPVAYRRCEPSISMIICAHNEAASIGKKLDNALSLDYPPEKLEVIVASDGSDDATVDIAQGYVSRGVRVLALPRDGKIAALNAAIHTATGDLLVFSDANSMYAHDALRALVRPFGDPEIGCVAGDQRYVAAATEGGTADGERVYWNLDRKTKEWASGAGSATSATGAIYAIRRSLFRTVPTGVTDDFVISTRAVAAGFRLVFAGDAAAYENVAARSNAEFRRKVRVMTRGLNGVRVMRELLNPARFGVYSVQVFSYKLLRRLVVIPLLVVFCASLALWNEGAVYRASTALQLAMYGAALLGGACELMRIRPPKIISLPYYFVVVNAAALVAFVNVLRGRRVDRWTPRGEAASDRRSSSISRETDVAPAGGRT